MKFFPAALITLALSTAAMAQESGAEESVFAGTIAQSIAAIIVFSILFALLYKFAWGPILKGLQDRENKIRHDLEHAENSAKQATATLEEYRAQLATAHDEVRKVIEQGRADAERLRAQLTEQTQAEINSMRVRAQAEILAAKEQAISELQTQYATVATEVAAKILRRQITNEDQKQLVADSLAATSQLAKNN